MSTKTEIEEANDFKISVVIPYYNAKDFFRECFDSIYRQTYQPFEIIIVDDASDPDHASFLDQFEDIARVAHLKSNLGAGEARNIGVSMATGDWVAFQDSDDLWALDKLEKQVAYLRENDRFVGCHTGVITFDEQGEKARYCSKPSPLTLKDLVNTSHVTPPSFLVKKRILDEFGGFDTNFKCSEDYELTIRIVRAGLLIGFVSEPLIRVRRSGHGNLSSNGLRTFRYHVKLVSKHRKVFLSEGGFNVVRRFLAKSLAESGGKLGGLKGRMIYYLGRMLGL